MRLATFTQSAHTRVGIVVGERARTLGPGMDRARDAIDAGEREEAIGILRELVATDPTDHRGGRENAGP